MSNSGMYYDFIFSVFILGGLACHIMHSTNDLPLPEFVPGADTWSNTGGMPMVLTRRCHLLPLF